MDASLATLTPSEAADEYARISPPDPSRIPPKYRVTVTAQFIRSPCRSTSRMGLPAGPDGSPSSLILSRTRPSPSTHIAAYATCRALGCSWRTESTNSSASSNASTWHTSAMNSDFFSTSASCAGRSDVSRTVFIGDVPLLHDVLVGAHRIDDVPYALAHLRILRFGPACAVGMVAGDRAPLV